MIALTRSSADSKEEWMYYRPSSIVWCIRNEIYYICTLNGRIPNSRIKYINNYYIFLFITFSSSIIIPYLIYSTFPSKVYERTPFWLVPTTQSTTIVPMTLRWVWAPPPNQGIAQSGDDSTNYLWYTCIRSLGYLIMRIAYLYLPSAPITWYN